MSNIERDAEELGKTLQPNPKVAYARLHPRLSHRGWQFAGWRVAGVLAGGAAVAALSLVLVGALASWGPLGDGHPLGAAPRGVGSTAGGVALRSPLPAGNGGAPVSSTNGGGGGAATTPLPTSGHASAGPASAPATFPGPRTQPPAPTHASGSTVTITEQTSGQIFVTRGTTVDVSLTGHPPYRWSVPTSSETQVLTPVSSSTDSKGDASGVFTASATGQSTISATDSPVCSPLCGAPSRLWEITITVT